MTEPLMDLPLQIGVPNVLHGMHLYSIQIVSYFVSSKCFYLLFQIDHVPHSNMHIGVKDVKDKVSYFSQGC
jgi:hypothetical protein